MKWSLKNVLTEHVYFKCYKGDSLFYETDDGAFVFEIPLKELGGSEVAYREKGSLFMKWVKKAFKDIEEAKAEQL